MAEITKVTNIVIAANTIISASMGSNVILERHIANNQINLRHLTTEVSSISPANDYATYVTLNAKINTVQDNVAAVASRFRFLNSNTSTSTSNVFFLGAPGTILGSNTINIFISGVKQPNTEWVFNSGNGTIQLKDASFPSGLLVTLETWYS